MIDKTTLWIVIIALGIGSFFLRFVFTGLVGSRAMPDWLLRHLRYTAVAILPALVAPQVIWPQATGGETEPARLAAACVTLLVGLLSKNVIAAILSGAFTLYGLLYLLG
ncbi:MULTISPECIES: AzlD domain-containing protein [Sulfitobacter]|jgi:branched-subunit amino acid transport protein|uniref:Branched-subunit amino acid transport protein n=1 Tax=Sulfitobacter mediterraneus TaxID=83219 RepID=A0A2T6CFL6_9RHOB|nr:MULTISPECIES: AzlD domain-containing protein [Sulfitobacter]KIN77742.1 branched-chain amino acid ABC transporter protein [Sulfitobacter mediterraneus KCTC 32188]PTX74284.1 branched-subunit amino acid transport protein [Sulfitobacter mediterraneus]UWR12123.1 AzlD domain-containing protein [Sulfitobacter mediterraneus]UWR16094.1 AzlD domain-containing protein [Sulfitobacter sp. M368]